MYKSRFSQWKFDNKHFKSRHVKAIMRKKAERDEVGKLSEFSIRGRHVTADELQRYLKRNPKAFGAERRASDSMDEISTPSSIGVWTPSPSPQSSSESDPIARSSGNDKGVDDEVRSSFRDESHTLQRRPPSLLLPLQDAQRTESLFWYIKEYVNECFSDGVWVITESSSIASTLPLATLPNQGNTQCNPSTFSQACSVASDLIAHGEFIQARQQLSTAYSMVKNILLSEDPRTLQAFFGVLLLLQQKGLADIAMQLQWYIGAMAKAALPSLAEGSSRGAFRMICELIALSTQNRTAASRSGTPDECTVALYSTAWQCLVDSYKYRLGPLHSAAVDCEMELLGRASEAPHSQVQNYELIYRKILVTCDTTRLSYSSSVRLRLLLALGCNLLAQSRFYEASLVADDYLARSAASYLHVAFALEMQAQAQYGLGRIGEARTGLLNAATIMADHHSWSDPWVTRAQLKIRDWEIQEQMMFDEFEPASRQTANLIQYA